MTDPRFFRKYLDIVNEASPTPASTPADPTPFQQAKQAVGQQYDVYKTATQGVDLATKQGSISQKDASDIKAQTAGSMTRGGWEAAKAAMQGRDPASAYAGSMMRSTGSAIASSGLDPAKAAQTVQQFRGPAAKDITQDPSFTKLSKEKQQQAVQAQQQIRDMSDEEFAAVAKFNPKQAGADLQSLGQEMIDQKTANTRAASGFVPGLNANLGVDTTRQATNTELNAVTKPANEELDRLKQLIKK